MEKVMIIENTQEMIELGKRIGENLKPQMIITLLGDLGAGKTTLTKGIAQGMGITDVVNSPTFTIMKIYQGKYPLYHLDVYRITNPDTDFELEEYIDSDGVSVIEWAENIKKLLPDEVLEIKIFHLDDNMRKVIINANDEKYIKIINEACK
ncbi:MAG TPA: tRNA (adenosine(37)-N6)-threonylcarbamoyltransferase complex ATPase subunit type 1 TsaE [Acholeplasmataceae bacterium]|nr:tRNA (adenosine(37)-N6)-threonylcarbamoyltransferase complex ATPase subunit type 1 TsaE [Acholeplasmataceae bacterium]